MCHKFFTCVEVGQDIYTGSRHLQQQATHTRERPIKISTSGVTIGKRKNYSTPNECKRVVACNNTFFENDGVHMQDSILCAIFVKNIIPEYLVFITIREVTLERDIMRAVNVRNLLSVAPAIIIIREFTLEKGLVHAVNMGKRLPVELDFVTIRVFRSVKGLMNSVNMENL